MGVILEEKNLEAWLQDFRQTMDKLVFTNGCFDILHAGHVDYLQNARQLGDGLLVGLNNDKSVRKLKGDSRPIVDEKARAMVLAALDAVDAVVLFKEETPGAKNEGDFLKDINPESLQIIKAKAEPSLKSAAAGDTFQFQRKGYFTVDKKSKADNIIFNKTVGLRDSWKH